MPKYSKIIWQRTYYFYSISKMIQYFEDLETFSFRLSPLSVLHYVSTVYQYTKLGEGRVRGSRYNARTGNNVSICQWGAKRPNSHKKKKKIRGRCRPPALSVLPYSVRVYTRTHVDLHAVSILYILYLQQVSLYPRCPPVDLQL